MIVASRSTRCLACDLIAGDRVSGPGLDGAECASLNARDLNESRNRVAGHSQMMFQRRLRRVLDDPGTRIVCRRDQCRGHRRRHADLRLAAALGGRERRIVLAQVTDRRRRKHALADLLCRKLALLRPARRQGLAGLRRTLLSAR